MGKHRKQPERKPIPAPGIAVLAGAFLALVSAPIAANSTASYSPGASKSVLVKSVSAQKPKLMPPPKPKAPKRFVPIMGMQGLKPNAVALAEYVSATYPAVRVIGGVRYDPLPDHPSGHAIDIMTDTNTALGNEIYADIISQRDRFGIRYTLWQVANHYDHIHITVY